MGKSLSIYTLLFWAACVFTAKVQAQESPATNGNNYLGIRVSSEAPVLNNSITYKRFFSQQFAVEGLFSFGDPAAIGLLLEKYTPLGNTRLSWFWGAGAYAGFGGSRRGGAQGAIGLDYVMSQLPLNFSLDWKPELNISRQFSFEPAAIGFSARFVFGR